jgi:hypothetical protein
VPETKLAAAPARCDVCGKIAPKARLPRGWHRSGEDTLCNEDWAKRYVLRAISMQVGSPLDCDWKQLNAAIRPMWIETTRCANWMMTELYARDIRREDQEKMPPMPRIYLYPEAREKFPALPSSSVASLEQSVQRKYRAKRYEILWTHSAALPTFRYPTPYAAPNATWHATIENDRPIVSVRIQDARLRLRLKTGPQYRLQLTVFRLIVRGKATQGECAIYQRGNALMFKFAAWVPREERGEKLEETLTVRTAKESLLVAVNMKDEKLWTYNGDHLRRWQAEHRYQLQRWSEDAKYENRPVPSFAERRKAAVHKLDNRMSSALHEVAAQLAGYAKRRRFAAVIYDDAERSYIEQFPYFRLRALINEKLDAVGVGFTVASGKVVEETKEPLAEE